MPALDWAEIWRDLVEGSRPPGAVRCNSQDWWARRRRYHRPPEERWQRPNMFLNRLLERLDPSSTVIDVGAGTGAWTIPIARRTARVTAVEPSPYMMQILRQRVLDAGLTNVELVAERWEDIAAEAHSFVLCSHGMYASSEIVPFLEKMHNAAIQSCCLVMRTTSRSGQYEELWRDLNGIHRPDGPHLVVAYNVLHAMGIDANVAVQPEASYWISESLDEAVDMARDVLFWSDDEGDDVRLREYLSRYLAPVDGGLRWPEGLKAGMIWWDKEDR